MPPDSSIIRQRSNAARLTRKLNHLPRKARKSGRLPRKARKSGRLPRKARKSGRLPRKARRVGWQIHPFPPRGMHTDDLQHQSNSPWRRPAFITFPDSSPCIHTIPSVDLTGSDPSTLKIFRSIEDEGSLIIFHIQRCLKVGLETLVRVGVGQGLSSIYRWYDHGLATARNKDC